MGSLCYFLEKIFYISSLFMCMLERDIMGRTILLPIPIQLMVQKFQYFLKQWD